jgi:hypothetical protein
MGAASSLSSQCLDFVDETEARRLCGDAWDEARWREAAPNGLVPRAQFVAAVPRADLPYHGRAILAESLTNDGGSGDAEGYSDDEFEYSLSDFEELDIDKKVSFARSGELARVVHTRTMTAPEDVPELFWDQRELDELHGADWDDPPDGADIGGDSDGNTGCGGRGEVEYNADHFS